QWDIAVMYGPHGAPDFFTPEDIEEFFDACWEVHYNSSRTGVRLIGPRPRWARADGGEAGLHPSNIHDNAYAIGAIDFTGDMPVILGPDGPSLGGFVCPATIVRAELWKIGQLRPGDRVRFHCIDAQQALALEREQEDCIRTLTHATHATKASSSSVTSPIVLQIESSAEAPAVCYRQAGDKYLLVEYGPHTLDLVLRLRAHALMAWLEQAAVPGVCELTP